jgi:hypothetical protein
VLLIDGYFDLQESMLAFFFWQVQLPKESKRFYRANLNAQVEEGPGGNLYSLPRATTTFSGVDSAGGVVHDLDGGAYRSHRIGKSRWYRMGGICGLFL